ncbi:unnamed protein product [Rhizophagus irregularis]|nr:unnamed protein product [Rhizophagus irregularis]
MRLVGSFGKNFELCQRDDTIKTLWNAGGPGIGKSRFLDEVEELIKEKAEESQNNDFKNMITINTTYGNSTIADEIDVRIQAQPSLALRILYKYFQPKHKDYAQSYNFLCFRACCMQANPDISLLTLDIALQIIYKDFVQINPTTLDPLLVLVLGIDEFNKLHVQNQEVCRNLIHAIGASMCASHENIYFIPILAGTIEGPLNSYISGSMHEPLHLPLRLLNDDDAIKIGMKMKLFDDEYVRLDPYFRLSISDVGGHVRTLEYYYEYFSGQCEKDIKRIKQETEEMMSEEEILKTAVYNVKISGIMTLIIERIGQKYLQQLNSRWLTIPLANAILGFPVQKNDAITLKKSSMTYQELSSMGIVNLVPTKQTNEYLIRLPYVWVCAIVGNSNDPGLTYWKSMLNYDEPMNWSNFEDFNTKFWALRLCLFRLIGYKKIELKTLFKGADFSLSFPDVEVDLPQIKDIKLYKLLHQYPVTKTYENNQVKYANIKEIRNGYIDLDLLKDEMIKSYIGSVFLNASGAPFDAFGYLNKSSESAGEICVAQQSKSIITSKVIINKNKSSESAGEICVAQQSKSTQTSMVTVNQKLFDKEHNKSTEALPEKDLVLLFLTNADKKNNLSIYDKPNSALVSMENFPKFYGYTYASRAQFASANEKVYINSAPVESLVILGFNEDERINIRLKRKERPFDNIDDIKKRLGIDDEKCKKLKLARIFF